MLEKNVRLLILPLLLSAALSFAACSSLSEDVPSDTSTPLLISGEPSEESEKISESEQQSASEETKRTSAEEITTPYEGEPGTARQETPQSSDTAPNFSDTALGEESPQTDGASYSQPVSANAENSAVLYQEERLGLGGIFKGGQCRIRNPLHRLFRQRRLCPKSRPLPKRQPCRKPIRP